MLSADRVIAPSEATVKALEKKRRMIEIELTKPQEAHCFLSEPVQDNLFQKGASQNGAVSACVMHDLSERGGKGSAPRPAQPCP
jgi:hypothetical protein